MPQRIFNMRIDEVAVMSLAHKTTWGAGLTTIAASVAEWNWAAIIAGSATLGGFAVNWYYRHCDKKRKDAESAARIAALKTQAQNPGVSS